MNQDQVPTEKHLTHSRRLKPVMWLVLLLVVVLLVLVARLLPRTTIEGQKAAGKGPHQTTEQAPAYKHPKQ